METAEVLMSEDSYSLETPWLGPESFTEAEADRFFGREVEKKQLVEMVEDGLLTVLFGDSGLGKTSLIRAGLFPELRKRFYTPIYFRLRFEEDGPTLIEQVWRKVYALAGLDWQVDGYPGSFWEWFHDREQGLLGERLAGVSLVLVFDQFEEVFTKGLGPDLGERSREFLQQLADLVENRLPVELNRILKSSSQEPVDIEHRKELNRRYLGPRDSSLPPYRVVLSLRADYLYLFDRLTGRMPSAMKRRMELTPMAKTDALEAIRNPGKHLIDPDVAEELVERLDPEDPSEKEFSLGGETVESVRIQPGVLSLVCHRLNRERIERKEQKITLKRLGEKFDSIFEDYYDEAVKDLPVTSKEYLEETLIGPFGHRTHIPRSAIEESIGKAAVESLVNSHLVQGDERGGTKYVEFVHDRFAAVARARRDARREDAEKAARLAREEEEARNRRAAVEIEARHEAEKAAASKRLREEHEAELAKVGESLSAANEKLGSREKAFERFQERTRRGKVVMIVWLVISLLVSASLISATFWMISGLKSENSELVESVINGEAEKKRVTEELAKMTKDSVQLSEKMQRAENQLSRSEVAIRERDLLLVENVKFRTRVFELEAAARSLAVETEPGEVAPLVEVVPEPDPIELEIAAIALVEAYLRAGSGNEAKEQWEYFAESADYWNLPNDSPREKIREEIKKIQDGLQERSYWLMALPKMEARDGDSFTLVALYGFKLVKNDKPSWGASVSRFNVDFGSGSNGSLRSFLPIRDTFAEPLSKVDQFQFVYDRWSELTSSTRYPSQIRNRWLALMTQQLYVMAGNDYAENLLDRLSVEAKKKIQNQEEFFAEKLDYFQYGEVSRDTASEKLDDYATKWPNRSLTNLSEPLVGEPDLDGNIEVTGQLNSRTENEEKVIELVVPSKMKIRNDPDRGSEIVSVHGGTVGAASETPKSVPEAAKPSSFFRKLFQKKK